MFLVKIAIPVVPTIKVLVTFTKFEELQSSSEEFSTPLSSPAHFQDVKTKEPEGSGSWISWMKGSHRGQSSAMNFAALKIKPTRLTYILITRGSMPMIRNED
ncbi:putative ankyrin repeat domain-containing protein [Helianthus annuus]|nr:putative ankyrin repeat domain-containing protein [Helianthus annuus]